MSPVLHIADEINKNYCEKFVPNIEKKDFHIFIEKDISLSTTVKAGF
ncbi:hypothetical protein [Candidatus Hodarchaeum mangrovi]